MILNLVRTPDSWRAPYGKNGALVAVPERMRWMHPSALAALELSLIPIITSSVFRSAAAQEEAYRTKTGVQKPGWSAHNFGLAIDLDINRIVDKVRKPDLDLRMRQANWRCYRDDSRLGPECWHYTYSARSGGSAAVEEVIQRYYGKELCNRDPKLVQTELAMMKLYDGAIDGKLGPQSKRALMLFQRQWKLTENGEADPTTCRLLHVITASKPNGG